MICRRVMVPRNDVEFLDVNWSFAECLELTKRTKHTRYPLCDGSLDKVLGVIHLKDLLGLGGDTPGVDLREFMRPSHKVPEHMPISRVLRHFQVTHQLLAFVVDEHGTMVGIVTLENVLEEIVGPVEDEFDAEEPNIVPAGPGEFIVSGSTPIAEVERSLELELDDADVDTVSGVLMSRSQKMPVTGDRVQLPGAVAEILETKGDRATRIRFIIGEKSPRAEKTAVDMNEDGPAAVDAE